MSKKNPVVLDYNGQRILLETIASYCPIHSNKTGEECKYGVRFYLRTGETIEQLGNDDVSRNNVVAFLDNYFKPINFVGNKCQVCVHNEDFKKRACFTKHDCRDYSGLRSFKRIEEINADVSSDI